MQVRTFLWNKVGMLITRMKKRPTLQTKMDNNEPIKKHPDSLETEHYFFPENELR